MGTKQVPGKFDCYANAEIDEPLFVLLARDPTAPDLIRMWANERAEQGGDPEKVQEAYACADAMDKWRDSKLPEKIAREIHMSLPLEVIAQWAEKRGIAVDAPLPTRSESEIKESRDAQLEANAAIIREHARVGDVLTHTRCMGVVEEHIFEGWDGIAIVGKPTPDTAVISGRYADVSTDDISPLHVTHINRTPLNVVALAVREPVPNFGAVPKWINEDLQFEPSEQFGLADMANVGYELMQALPKGYVYSDSPAEIVTDLQNRISDLETSAREPASVNENALTIAAKKLRKLRLTDVGDRKENPQDTVKSVLQKGLGGFYDDKAVQYILDHGLRYYLAELQKAPA